LVALLAGHLVGMRAIPTVEVKVLKQVDLLVDKLVEYWAGWLAAEMGLQLAAKSDA